MGRALKISGIAVLILLLAFAAVGWHYSNEILGPDDPPARSGETVLDFTDSTVTFAPSFKVRRPGRWALDSDGCWGELGPVIDSSAGRITRTFRPIAGSLMPGPARVAGFAVDAEPHGWLGLDFETVGIPARVGALPAWKIDGADSTWVIGVHGRGATRAELLRMLPAYVGLGLPCLVIGYRGDLGGPHAPGGGYRMGWTEWLDLEDAVRYAADQGARDVVLVGCSMGGGIVTQFLRHSPLRDHVRAVVLDAPALDWNTVLATAAEKRRVPALLTEAGKRRCEPASAGTNSTRSDTRVPSPRRR